MSQIPITCLNGTFLRANRAAVPVTDRGFRFGDGVFETIRLHRGVPYQWAEHLQRLSDGLAALRIPMLDIDWAYYARRVIARNAASEGFLRIAVSRGSGSRGYMPYPPDMPPTWVIEYLPPQELPSGPLRLWLSSIARVPPHCLPMNMKLAQGVGSTLAMLEARDHECDDAMQLSTSGMICETASANVFWVKGDTLYTPSLETGCLAGTTRQAILRLSPMPIRSVQAGLADIERADTLFMANARLGVWPIASLHPMDWNFNRAHPIISTLTALLDADRAKQSQSGKPYWSARP